MRTGQLIDWRERERVKVNNGSDAREAVVRKARHAISSSLRWWHCWLGVIAGHERSRNALDVWRGILSWRKLGRVYQERKEKKHTQLKCAGFCGSHLWAQDSCWNAL